MIVHKTGYIVGWHHGRGFTNRYFRDRTAAFRCARLHHGSVYNARSNMEYTFWRR